MPVAKLSPKQNNSTLHPGSPTGIPADACDAGMLARIPYSVQYPNSTPKALARQRHQHDSASNCRINCQRDASHRQPDRHLPRPCRTAPSCRFATFAHAINSTSNASDISSQRPPAFLPWTAPPVRAWLQTPPSWPGTAPEIGREAVSATATSCSSWARYATLISSAARSMVTPGFRRPTIVTQASIRSRIHPNPA
jgi:hypothetical protein